MAVRSRCRTSASGRERTLAKLKFICHCPTDELLITIKVADYP